MSRIGRLPIALPPGVEVAVEPGQVRVSGPKGSLTQAVDPSISVSVEAGQVVVGRRSEETRARAQHGLARTLLSNMVKGVSEGFTVALDIVGVGYRATQQGGGLSLALGYSHPVEVSPEPGIEFALEVDARAKTNRILVKGIDKQRVGQVAADIRSLRPPEPYKGKGIRYAGEVVARKMGKAGKAGK